MVYLPASVTGIAVLFIDVYHPYKRSLSKLTRMRFGNFILKTAYDAACVRKCILFEYGLVV